MSFGRPSRPTSCTLLDPVALSNEYVREFWEDTRPHTVSCRYVVLPSYGIPFSYDFRPSFRMSSLISPKFRYRSPPSKLGFSGSRKGLRSQNCTYSMLLCSKLVLSILRMMPPHRFSGLSRLPWSSIFVASRLYGPLSVG